MSAQKILCIDDSVDICDLLALHLGENNYIVQKAHNSEDAIKAISSFRPDLVLLDVLLPDGDGLSLMNTIKSTDDIPVVMISGRGEDIDKIVAIEAGADDYVTKPFNIRELLARIAVILKRYTHAGGLQDVLSEGRVQITADKISFDNWVMDRNQYQVYDAEGNSAKFTTNEFLLLERLAIAPYQVLTREQLFEVWKEQGMNLYDRAIDVQITRIRNKLLDNPKDSKYIKTIRGVGYMFTGQSAPSEEQ